MPKEYPEFRSPEERKEYITMEAKKKIQEVEKLSKKLFGEEPKFEIPPSYEMSLGLFKMRRNDILKNPYKKVYHNDINRVTAVRNFDNKGRVDEEYGSAPYFPYPTPEDILEKEIANCETITSYDYQNKEKIIRDVVGKGKISPEGQIWTTIEKYPNENFSGKQLPVKETRYQGDVTDQHCMLETKKLGFLHPQDEEIFRSTRILRRKEKWGEKEMIIYNKDSTITRRLGASYKKPVDYGESLSRIEEGGKKEVKWSTYSRSYKLNLTPTGKRGAVGDLLSSYDVEYDVTNNKLKEEYRKYFKDRLGMKKVKIQEFEDGMFTKEYIEEETIKSGKGPSESSKD